jgi:UDP:flavonoid glycosyltransferase YjiC (YdhE family)
MTIEGMQETLDSLADLDIEVVVTLPDDARAKLDRIPANVRVVDFVPLHAVLPSCSLVINHGGAGSFNASVRSGVPQLLISPALDGPFKVHHLRRLKAGDGIMPHQATGARIRECVVQLLEDPGYAEGAARLRDEVLAFPTPNEVVPELEKLTAKYRA